MTKLSFPKHMMLHLNFSELLLVRAIYNSRVGQTCVTCTRFRRGRIGHTGAKSSFETFPEASTRALPRTPSPRPSPKSAPGAFSEDCARGFQRGFMQRLARIPPAGRGEFRARLRLHHETATFVSQRPLTFAVTLLTHPRTFF